MGAVRINFASLVLFYDQYKHQNGRKVVKMYPFLVLALVAKQNYSCKIGAGWLAGWLRRLRPKPLIMVVVVVVVGRRLFLSSFRIYLGIIFDPL